MRRPVLAILSVCLALGVAAVLVRPADRSLGDSLTTEALRLYRANRPQEALARYRQAAALA